MVIGVEATHQGMQEEPTLSKGSVFCGSGLSNHEPSDYGLTAKIHWLRWLFCCIGGEWDLYGKPMGRSLNFDDQRLIGRPTMRLKWPSCQYIAPTRATSGLTMDCRVSLRWHFCCGCPISKPRPVLGFSSNKSGVVFCYFFEKSKNELVRPKMMFLAILAKIWWSPDNSDM